MDPIHVEEEENGNKGKQKREIQVADVDQSKICISKCVGTVKSQLNSKNRLGSNPFKRANAFWNGSRIVAALFVSLMSRSCLLYLINTK